MSTYVVYDPQGRVCAETDNLMKAVVATGKAGAHSIITRDLLPVWKETRYGGASVDPKLIAAIIGDGEGVS